MLPKNFDELPVQFQKEDIRPYFLLINKRRKSLIVKKLFDIFVSLVMLILLSPILLVSAILIKCTSKGPVFFRQTRIGELGKEFQIHKFRSMVQNADKKGIALTVGSTDARITKIGSFLRKTRIDEFPQLIDVLCGNMTLVGARPEVKKYVEHYSDEMLATLLLKPGISGKASLEFKNENDMLVNAENPEEYYINEIIPIKMAINLRYLENFSFITDIKILFYTFICIFKH